MLVVGQEYARENDGLSHSGQHFLFFESGSAHPDPASHTRQPAVKTFAERLRRRQGALFCLYVSLNTSAGFHPGIAIAIIAATGWTILTAGTVMAAGKRIHQVVNVVGLAQPQSGFLVANALDKLEPGGIIEIITSERDFSNLVFPVWRQKKYAVTETREAQGNFCYTVLKK